MIFGVMKKPVLSPTQFSSLIETLRKRFEKNTKRHAHIEWSFVEKRLKDHPGAAWSVFQMEETGGEPDVVEIEAITDAVTVIDCSAETPAGRWLKTPSEVRKLGGAIFGDYRYGRVFIYHNGVQSYYAARSFRGWVKV
jgi:hypothetical protein